MVIIEMTPSVNQPLTPTAPPKSRSHSVDADMDQYYTPLTHIPKPPLSRDATDDLAKYVNLGKFRLIYQFPSVITTAF